ncbi:hypothetical protein PHAVU_006G141300, partial [Phaseolus vulgaris]
LGYVDRAFAIEFQKELGEKWTLADSAGNVHIVEYNQDLLSPEIMTGWWTLAGFYGFEGDHTILFRYVGQNAFHITVYVEDGILPGFSEYLRQGRFKTVTLLGLLKDVECKVLKGRFPYRTIKLGSSRKNFCRRHSFRSRQKIIFECDSMNPSSHIRVLLLMISFEDNFLC